MAQYIDGFVLPIPLSHKDRYQEISEAISKIWIEHGALDYREFIGDDMSLEGTRSFVDLLSAKGDEMVLFGWVVFDSREARNSANAKVAADPRMADLFEASEIGFDPKRMAYGGFQSFVELS